jgi:hypothetical protein
MAKAAKTSAKKTSEKKAKLFTIGYEQTPAKSVLDELEAAGVKLAPAGLLEVAAPGRAG